MGNDVQNKITHKYFGYSFLFSCSSPAQNKQTAYVEKYQDSFLITIVGKRHLLVHDPVSLFQTDNYYLDSALFTIAGKMGFVNFKEVQMLSAGSYPFVQGGITMTNDSLLINLSFDDYDDKIIRPLTWNGNYLIHWRN